MTELTLRQALTMHGIDPDKLLDVEIGRVVDVGSARVSVSATLSSQAQVHVEIDATVFDAS